MWTTQKSRRPKTLFFACILNISGSYCQFTRLKYDDKTTALHHVQWQCQSLNKQTGHFDHFTVRYLIENNPGLESIDARSPVREALEKMCSKKYSQLPVIKDEKCIGAVTFECIMSLLKEQGY